MLDVLAFGFVSPAIAAFGAAAATGPIILHILNRRRFRLLDWAPMRFLLLSQKRNRRRLRLEEWLLLALRCLLILLVALAIARPRTTAALAPTLSAQPVDTALVLDDSLSMTAARAGAGGFDSARQELSDRLAEMRDVDSAAVYRTRDAGRRAWRELAPVADPDGAAQAALTLRPSDTHGALAATLEAAGAALADSTQRRRVVVLSDFRLRDFEDAQARAMRQAAERLAEAGIELELVDHGPRIDENLAVTELTLLDKDVIANAPARFRVTVRNYGDAGAADVRLKLAAGRIELNHRIEAIPAGQSRSVEIPVTLAAVGPTVVTAELGADGLAGDNRRLLAVEVRRARPILIVDGQGDPMDPETQESLYIATALDPDDDGSLGNAVEIVPAASIPNVRWSRYDLVILTDVARMPGERDEQNRTVYPQVDALRRYVEAGGALAIFAGPNVDLDFYNSVLHPAGLIPYRLQPATGDARRRRGGWRFAPGSAEPIPMLRAFAAGEADFAGLFRFYRFYPAEQELPAPQEDAVGPPQTLIRLDDEASSPAIAERRIGAGRAMMFYSTASKLWNDWPGSYNFTFPAVMTDMVARLARSWAGQRTALVGAPVVHEGLGPAPERATVKSPDYPNEDVAELAIESGGRGWSVRHDGAIWAGVYELRFEPAAVSAALYARNVDPAEGDLRKADRQALATALGDDAFIYVNRLADEGDESAALVTEYWRWLLLAALATLGLEVFLAQRFGHYGYVGSARPAETRGARA